jgi:hypothetical protein
VCCNKAPKKSQKQDNDADDASEINKHEESGKSAHNLWLHVLVCVLVVFGVYCRLTKKAEPSPTRGVNRDSGTANANGGWRLVRLP